jgi:dethiobiotin synthase
MNRYFITATGTDVGKTIFTAGILRHLRNKGRDAISVKPVQTGAESIDGQLVAPDLLAHWKAANFTPSDDERALMAPYLYEPACSPHLAGRMAGNYPDIQTILRAIHDLEEKHDDILVEGAGGVYAPLNEDYTMLDLMKKLEYPVILVAHRGLGTLNHTLLSLEVMREAGLEIAGVILNEVDDVEPDFIKLDNPDAIEAFGRVPIVGNVDYLGSIESDPEAAWAKFESYCKEFLSGLE